MINRQSIINILKPSISQSSSLRIFPLLRRSTKCPSLPAGSDDFGEPKVDELHIAASIEQQVLRFEIAIDNAATVEVMKRLDDATTVKPRGGVVEIHTIPQNRPQFSAEAAFQQHVQILAIFKRLVQFDDKSRVGATHDALLVHDVLLLTRVDDVLLLHHFERVRAGIVAGDFDQLDAAESADAQRGDDLQIFQFQLVKNPAQR